jgi:glutathione S-transferase
MTDQLPTLLTIPISHYCERARWALDYALVSYREEPHLQMYSRKAVKRAGGKRTTPVLVTSNDVLRQSHQIVEYADRLAPKSRKLFPDDPALRAEVERYERRFEADFGVECRRLAYYILLPHPRLLLRHNNHAAPLWESVMLYAMFPLAKGKLAEYLQINDETAKAAEKLIWETLDQVARDLGSRRYLVGDRFTAADLTFAALLGPLVLSAQYGVPLPTLDEVPSEVASRVRAFREHRAGRHALAVYQAHRPISAMR